MKLTRYRICKRTDPNDGGFYFQIQTKWWFTRWVDYDSYMEGSLFGKHWFSTLKDATEEVNRLRNPMKIIEEVVA